MQFLSVGMSALFFCHEHRQFLNTSLRYSLYLFDFSFVLFLCVFIQCLLSLPLSVMGWLRYMIVAVLNTSVGILLGSFECVEFDLEQNLENE